RRFHCILWLRVPSGFGGRSNLGGGNAGLSRNLKIRGGDQPMHLNEPRINPLPESEWNDDTKELLETLRRDGQVYNIFATLARHPQLLKRWLVFGGHVLGKSTLPARDREIAILRMGWLCKA